MLRITLGQMRRALPRLVAAGVAIVIGTAFVATTLLAGGVMTRSGNDAVTARYGKADLVFDNATLDAAGLQRLRALPQVAAADPQPNVGVQLRAAGVTRWLHALTAPTDPRLATLRVVSGTAPSAAGQIALPVGVASALHLGVGDTVGVPWTPQPPTAGDGTDDGAATDPPAQRIEDVRVVGLLDDPNHAWTAAGDAALVTPSDAARWNGLPDVTAATTTYVVALRSGSSSDAARAAISALDPDASVLTRDEAAQGRLQENTGDGHVLVALALAFAGIALLVAALVIANTFQVLVAQRTRTLALLRCVGASKRQLAGSVLLEAALLGLGASLAGIVAGVVLAQAALTVLRRTALDVSLPARIDVTPAVVIAPLVVGTLVTLAAALVPAGAAARVAPVAALRPLETRAPTGRGGGLRPAAAGVLVVGGVLGLAAAVAAAHAAPGSVLLTLGVGVLTGAASFVGILLGAVYWVPWCVALVGRALGRAGVAARLAVANTARNPRRTSATSAALLIGVTLVAMMATGAASARASTQRELAAQFPVDMTIESGGGSDARALPAGLLATVAGLDGVAAAVPLRSTQVQLEPGGLSVEVRAAVDGSLGSVLREPSVARTLEDGTIALPHSRRGWAALTTGAAVMADDGTTGPRLGVRAVATSLGGVDALVTAATLDRLAPGLPTSAVWLRLDRHADPNAVQDAVTAAYPDDALAVTSPVADRDRYSHLIDTLLAIVVGLLGAAVVIALIGVANTLSLSVLERRRESATLRALGLTRARLRWSLGIEGMVIAGVGGVAGTALGLGYGWAGVSVGLGATGSTVLAVPWSSLALTVLVALVAGLLASVLPARSAARTPPVAALAIE